MLDLYHPQSASRPRSMDSTLECRATPISLTGVSLFRCYHRTMLRRAILPGLSSFIAVLSWMLVAATFRHTIVRMGGGVVGAEVYLLLLTNFCILFNAVVFTTISVRPALAAGSWWIRQAVIVNTVVLIGYWGAMRWDVYMASMKSQILAHGPLQAVIALYLVLRGRSSTTRIRDAFFWLAIPLVHTCIMEANGLLSGFYPYDEVDPHLQGWSRVLSSIGSILVVTLAASLTLMGIDRTRTRAASDGVQRYADTQRQ